MHADISSLILLRHGFAKIPADRCIGQLDVSLTNRGREAINQLAKNWPTPYPERIYCSDLRRTAETAGILADQMSLPVIYDYRLREISFGDWEGRSWEEIYRHDPHLMEQWGSDWLNSPPPRGENVVQLHSRVREFYEELLLLPQMPTLIIAHAGSLRALACLLHGRPLDSLFDSHFCHGAPISMV
ncbi:MAG: alpha-ribazole phosphatase family protein [Halioglobus sp.]